MLRHHDTDDADAYALVDIVFGDSDIDHVPGRTLLSAVDYSTY